MKPLFIYYPKCDTCRKAAKWLAQNDIETEVRDIVTQNPTAQELKQWIAKSDTPISKFFNTSGLKYKALGLKDIVKNESNDELIRLLASDGMLVKRPLLICEHSVLIGFNETLWSDSLAGQHLVTSDTNSQ